MNTRHRAAVGALFAVFLILLALSGCGRANKPGGTAAPSASPSATATAPGPTASPGTVPPSTVSPAPTQATTTPGGTTVVRSRVAYQWRWPNADGAATVTHSYPVPPLPQLVRIGVGNHPSDPGERPFNRMSFTFTTAFPSYQFEYVDKLVADGSGNTVPLEGLGVLRVTFRQAVAHNDAGQATIVSQPAAHLGLTRMRSYAAAGDYEGVLTYGIGIGWPVAQANPQIAVRAYEVETVDAAGQHRYVVAIDVDAS